MTAPKARATGRRGKAKAPASVLDRLALVGVLGPIRRKPQLTHCEKCGLCVYEALEACGDAVGSPVVLDATPVTINGEVMAATYSVPAYDHWGDCVTYRMPGGSQFVKTSSTAILVAHVCGASWEADETAAARLHRRFVAPAPDAPPPF